MKFTHRNIQTEEVELDISVDEIQRMKSSERNETPYKLYEPIEVEDW